MRRNILPIFFILFLSCTDRGPKKSESDPSITKADTTIIVDAKIEEKSSARTLIRDTVVGDIRITEFTSGEDPSADSSCLVIGRGDSLQDTLYSLHCCNYCGLDWQILNRTGRQYLRTDCGRSGGGDNWVFIGLFSLQPSSFLDTILYKAVQENIYETEYYRDTLIQEISNLTIQEISLHTNRYPSLEVTDSKIIYSMDSVTYRWYYHPSEEDEFLSTYDTLSMGRVIETKELN
jgi:hypothetical protein